jgi:hypothetical protein
MAKWVSYFAAFMLITHGLIHLLGTTVYLRLGEVAGFPYKTTLLGNSWDVGTVGIGIFGAMWAVAAVGFIVSAIAMLTDSSWWQPVLIGVTVFSLLLTSLDWNLAFAGVALNLVILVLVFLRQRSRVQGTVVGEG